MITGICILREEIAEEVYLHNNSMQLANTITHGSNLSFSLR